MAVQGGLLAAYLAGRRTEDGTFRLRDVVLPTGLFLVAKLVVYTLFGALLGVLGSFFQLTLWMRVSLQILVGIFMIAAALRLLTSHPLLRHFELRPPAFLRRRIRQSARGEAWFTPLVLGAFTIFIPCGTTQAMEVLAVASGNAALGALTLMVFVLGTVPLFFLVGVLAHTGTKAWSGAFAKVTALVVFAVGLYTVSSGMALAGSPYTIQRVVENYRALYQGGETTATSVATGEFQNVTINVTSNGYEPRNIELIRGVPVRLTLKTNNTSGCSRAFVIPSMKIDRLLPVTGEEVVEFTPTKKGNISFSCSMGMFTGKFTVLES